MAATACQERMASQARAGCKERRDVLERTASTGSRSKVRKGRRALRDATARTVSQARRDYQDRQARTGKTARTEEMDATANGAQSARALS